MSSQSNLPPTVVLGVNEMALAAARDLASRGVLVLAVHFGSGKSSLAYSRRLRFVNGPPIEQEEDLLGFLIELAQEQGTRPVLLPAQDQPVLFIDAHRRRLSEHFDFHVWDSEVLAKIASKAGLSEVAKQYDLPVPSSLAPHNRADIEGGIERLRFPCIVKPEFTNAWWTRAARELDLSYKAIEAETPEQVLDVYERSARVGSRIVVQEKIVGPDSNHLSYMAYVPQAGQARGEVVISKHRVYPPGFGVACFAEASLMRDAVDVGRGIVARLGYQGFISVQFKRDQRDEQLYLIELNLRLPLSVELPIRVGLSFPYFYYQTSRGEPYEVPPLRLGLRWMSGGRDFRAMRTYARQGTWTWGQWSLDVMRGPAFSIFSWSDPLPSCMGFLDALRAWCKKRLVLRRRFAK